MIRTHILVCAGTGCTSANSSLILERIKTLLAEKGLDSEVKALKTGCFGLCQKGPIVAIHPDNVFYSHVKVEDVDEIIEEHIYKGRPVERLMLHDVDEQTKQKVFDIDKIKFYAKQKRIALRNCGLINPEDINEYIARDGYEALGKVITQITPQMVIDEIKASGLRGRGGGGFPTGKKWQFAAD